MHVIKTYIILCYLCTDVIGVCRTERDVMFGIVWPNTEFGTVAQTTCPNGIGG